MPTRGDHRSGGQDIQERVFTPRQRPANVTGVNAIPVSDWTDTHPGEPRVIGIAGSQAASATVRPPSQQYRARVISTRQRTWPRTDASDTSWPTYADIQQTSGETSGTQEVRPPWWPQGQAVASREVPRWANREQVLQRTDSDRFGPPPDADSESSDSI